MKAKLIKVGKSKCIIIPDSLIKRYGLTEEIILEVRRKKLMVSPVEKPRKNWEREFRNKTKKSKV